MSWLQAVATAVGVSPDFLVKQARGMRRSGPERMSSLLDCIQTLTSSESQSFLVFLYLPMSLSASLFRSAQSMGHRGPLSPTTHDWRQETKAESDSTRFQEVQFLAMLGCLPLVRTVSE